MSSKGQQTGMTGVYLVAAQLGKNWGQVYFVDIIIIIAV